MRGRLRGFARPRGSLRGFARFPFAESLHLRASAACLRASPAAGSEVARRRPPRLNAWPLSRLCALGRP
eukprot:14533241-Alexandrium_andersonii.AAC.1